ncbi:MAG: CsgG/HfaB family protein [Chitinispirillaceae bacterium]
MKQLVLILLCAVAVHSKEHIAVIDFAPRGVDSTEAQVLSERLASELFRTDSFTLVEREMMQEILSEQGFQNTGCVDQSCIVEAGRMIGVRKVVGGSISKLGRTYSVSARLISVQTGKVLGSITHDHTGPIDELLPAMQMIARRLAGIEEDVREVESKSEENAELKNEFDNPSPRFGMTDNESADPIQLSFVPPIALVSSDRDIFGFRYNFVLGINQNVTGLDVGLINKVNGTMLGLQCGVINIAQTCNGFQYGTISKAESSESILQISVLNVSGGITGLQIGLINVCDHIKGMQVGLINVIKNGSGPSFCPILNFGAGPKKE